MTNLHLAQQDDQESRIHDLRKDFWVAYPRAEEITAHLDDLLVYPKKIRMPNMALIGETNNGKSRLLDRFVVKNTPEFDPNSENTVLPIMHIRLRGEADESRLYNAMLDRLFAGGPMREPPDTKLQRLIELLTKLQTKMIIVDEFQHAIVGTPHKLRKFLNAFKNLGSELQLPLVVAGTPEVLNALQADPQIANRFPPRHLPKWKNSDDFLSLLATIQLKLKLRNEYDLTDEDLAVRVLTLTEGILGEVVALLTDLAVLAIRTGEERITVQMLKDDSLRKIGWVAPSLRTRYER